MKLNHQTVTLRDGTKLELSEVDWVASLKMGRIETEQKEIWNKKYPDLLDPDLGKHPEAVISDPDEYSRFRFAIFFYPKLAGSCINGNTPTLEEALAMPAVELNKWYFASKEVNPDIWELTPAGDEKQVKKKMAGTHKRHRAAKAAPAP